jgi:hypothetical protein
MSPQTDAILMAREAIRAEVSVSMKPMSKDQRSTLLEVLLTDLQEMKDSVDLEEADE